MAGDGLKVVTLLLPKACPRPCNKSLFSALNKLRQNKNKQTKQNKKGEEKDNKIA
jgi:hypothetical protein